MNGKYNDDFNALCNLFCRLTKMLRCGGHKDLASIIDNLMSIWLDKTIIK